jgi:hypothetical protein
VLNDLLPSLSITGYLPCMMSSQRLDRRDLSVRRRMSGVVARLMSRTELMGPAPLEFDVGRLYAVPNGS